MEAHNRIAMFIYNNFEFTQDSNDILTYKQIYEVYKHSKLDDYFIGYGFTLSYKNFNKIIRNLFKDIKTKYKSGIRCFKQKHVLSNDYGLDGNFYFKKVIDSLIIPSKVRDCVLLKDLYNKFLENKYFGDDNIYLTTDKNMYWFQNQLFKHCEYFDYFKQQSSRNGKSVFKILTCYKFRE